MTKEKIIANRSELIKALGRVNELCRRLEEAGMVMDNDLQAIIDDSELCTRFVNLLQANKSKSSPKSPIVSDILFKVAKGIEALEKEGLTFNDLQIPIDNPEKRKEFIKKTKETKMDNIGVLEEHSLWYKYKSQVWLEKSKQNILVHNIMRMIRGIHNIRELHYYSAPITSGMVLYKLRLEKPEEDIGKLISLAIPINQQKSYKRFMEYCRKLNYPSIFPPSLTPINIEMEQTDFQALWLSVIAEKCTDHPLDTGWEFSNGGCEEFVHSWQLKLGLPRHPNLLFFNTKEDEELSRIRMRNIKTYDHKGNYISLNEGYKKMEKSLSWIHENGFESPKIENCLHLLEWTGNMIEKGFYQ